MAKAADHPSSLFRSLRPDDDDFQTSTSTAAREAEQRWPLFQAVAPRKPQATPLLSPQERSLWSTTQRPSGYERKPALSVPATGNKLAQSLSKMGARPASSSLMRSALRASEEVNYEPPTPAQAFVREEPSKKHGHLFSRDTSAAVEQPHEEQEATRPTQKFGRGESTRNRSSLFSKESAPAIQAPPAPQATRPKKKLDREETAKSRGSFFSKVTALAMEDQAEARGAARPSDSLTKLFSRLERQDTATEKPVSKPSSFFGRSGKR